MSHRIICRQLKIKEYQLHVLKSPTVKPDNFSVNLSRFVIVLEIEIGSKITNKHSFVKFNNDLIKTVNESYY